MKLNNLDLIDSIKSSALATVKACAEAKWTYKQIAGFLTKQGYTTQTGLPLDQQAVSKFALENGFRQLSFTERKGTKKPGGKRQVGPLGYPKKGKQTDPPKVTKAIKRFINDQQVVKEKPQRGTKVDLTIQWIDVSPLEHIKNIRASNLKQNTQLYLIDLLLEKVSESLDGKMSSPNQK